jgi:hypothetical protein
MTTGAFLLLAQTSTHIVDRQRAPGPPNMLASAPADGDQQACHGEHHD